MKLSINLLPPEPEAEKERARKKTIITGSIIVLVIFLIINLLIFGYYLYLTKNTADTLTATKAEENKVTSLAPLEKVYRSLGAKLSFLATAWLNPVRPEDALNFSQGLLSPQVTLERINFKQGGVTMLTLTAAGSGNLEEFLNKVSQAEKNGQIKDVRLNSSDRNKEGGYDYILSFKFLKI